MPRRLIIVDPDPARGAELAELFATIQGLEVGSSATSAEELRQALHQDGSLDGVLMTPRLARQLLQQAETDVALTERESEVLGLLARRRAYKEIAAELCLSAHTVHSHVKRIYEKLAVRGRREAISRARALGLLGDPEGRK